MKRSKSKIAVAALTAMTMAFTMMPGMAFAAAGTDAGASKVTVTFSAETADGFDMVPTSLEVSSDLTETYYPDVTVEPEDQVTVSDVIVAAHIEKYGDAFKEDPTAYYNVEDGTYETGFATVQFNRTSGSYMYYVNGVSCPSGICLDTVKDGDNVDTGLYADTTSWTDVYGSFDSRAYTVKAGAALSVSLRATNRDQAAAVDEGAAIMLLNKETGKVTDQIAKADKDGKASLKFDKKGTYYISAVGTATYTGYTGQEVSGRFMLPYAEVKVAEAAVKPAPADKKPAAKLKAPTVKVKAGKKYAKISWTKVAGAKGYQVYRATSKNGTYKKIADVSAKKLTVKSTKLKSKKTYYFKVRAYTKTSKGTFSKVKAVKVK